MKLAPSVMKRPVFRRMFSDEDIETQISKPMFLLDLTSLWRMYKGLYRSNSINFFPVLKVGDVVPKNSIFVHRLDKDEKLDLTEYQQDQNIPLVLNFGSCT